MLDGQGTHDGAVGRGAAAVAASSVPSELEDFALAAGSVGDVRVLVASTPADAVWIARKLLDSSSEPAVAVAAGVALARHGKLEGRGVEESLALLERAAPGQGLVSEEVASSVAGDAFRDCGIKGAVMLATPGFDGPATELPPALARLERIAPFFGREADLLALERAWKRVADLGDHRIAVVEGEPGMGKTRLLARLAARIAREGAQIAHARCQEEAALPVDPVARALESLDTAGVGEVDGRDSLRQREWATELLAKASAEAPVLLLVDDVHWAGTETLGLIEHLLEAHVPMAVLIVLAYRSAEVDDTRAAKVLQRIRRSPGATTVGLEGLSSVDLELLVGRMTGANGEERSRIAEQIFEETRGNPLFASELLRDLSESEGANSSIRSGPLPATVREVIGQRVRRLSPGCQDALTTAAVSGSSFELDVVARACGSDEAALADRLSEAERAGLIEADDAATFSFTHALIRRALSDEAGVAEIGRQHRALAEAIEELPKARRDALVEELARHWTRATPPDLQKAVASAEAAANAALEGNLPDLASEHFADALRAHGEAEDETRARLLLGCGIAQRQALDQGFRETLLESARLAYALENKPILRRAVLAGRKEFDNAVDLPSAERLSLLEAAIEGTKRSDPEAPLLLAALGADLAFSQDERRYELSERAVSLARETGDPDVLCEALNARFMSVWTPGSLAQRLAAASEAVELAPRVTDPIVEFRAVHWYAVVMVETREMERAEDIFDQQIVLAERYGHPVMKWISMYDRANRAMLQDRLDTAERLSSAAFEIATRNGHPAASAFYGAQLADIRLRQGRLGELQPLLAKLTAKNPRIPAFGALLATALVDAELRDEARAQLRKAAEGGFSFGWDNTWIPGHALYAHVCAELEDEPTAAVLYERLVPYGGELVWTGGTFSGEVDHALGRLAGVLGRGEEAIAQLERSVESYRELGMPFWHARAQLDLARVIADTDPTRAADLLDRAGATATERGSATVERRARALRDNLEAGRQSGVARPRPGAVAARRARRLQRAGDLWRIQDGETTFSLKDSVGLRYLAELLASPGVERHAVELAGTDAAQAMNVAGYAGDQPVLDERAKREYQERIAELEEELEEAERFNDPARAEVARSELEGFRRELAGSLGIGGRDRKFSSASERARVNVTRAIRRAIARIGDEAPDLGRELGQTVQTGIYCVYEPRSGSEPAWSIKP